MIKANFNSYSSYVTDSLYQWDINQVLTVNGLNLSVAPEVHFSNSNMDRAIVRQSVATDKGFNVDIPNSLLQDPLTIRAHVGIYEGNTFKVIELVEIPIIARTKPLDYKIEDSDEEIHSFKALQNDIANMVKKSDFNTMTATVNARIDNIIAHNNDTENNAELMDIRTDMSGTIHGSAGEAVRSQNAKMSRILSDVVIKSGTTIRVVFESRTQKTGLFLKAGVTYTMYTDEDKTANLFVAEDNSNYLSLSTSKKTFTPTVDGELTAYISSSNELKVGDTLNIIIKGELQSSIEEKVNNAVFNETVEKINDTLATTNTLIGPARTYSIRKGNNLLTDLRLITGHTYAVRFVDGTFTESCNFCVHGGAMYLRLQMGVTDFGYFTADNDGVVNIYNSSLNDGVDTTLTLSVYDITENIKSSTIVNKQYSNNTLRGFITRENLDDCDYCYLPVYGQSFTMANDGEYKLTNEFDTNCYMIGANSYGWSEGPINPLSTGENVEFIHADVCDLISRLYKKYAHKSQNFIVGSYGKGDKTILELSKNNGLTGHSWYEDQFLPGITAVKNAVKSEGKTFNAPALLFMQGESDYGSSYENGCKGDKNLYKERFLTFKNTVQTDIMSATGQKNPPIIMVYVVGGAFGDKYTGISQAINELITENDDIVSVGPYYQVTDFGAHPTPDGRRWLAEYIAKCYYETFIVGVNNTLSVGEIEIKDSTVFIHLKNVCLPLQFDTYTVSAKDYYGFRIYKNDTQIPINKVEFVNNTIVLTASKQLNGIIKVVYGNNSDDYEGNVKDSETWLSCYRYESNEQGESAKGITYIPRDKNGDTLIGKRYPMQKWLPNFCEEIII